jgi:hypothetical protein
MAGDSQGLPLRFVRAPHLGLRCMGNLLCMGLFLWFRLIPSPRRAHVPNDRLPSRVDVDVDVLNSHLLLSLATVLIQRFEKEDVGSSTACLPD